MKYAAVVLAAFAALAAASPIENAQQDVYLSSDKPKDEAPAAAPPSSGAGGNKCVECAAYCKDPSNGAAIGAACLIVKCGIQVRRIFFLGNTSRANLATVPHRLNKEQCSLRVGDGLDYKASMIDPNNTFLKPINWTFVVKCIDLQYILKLFTRRESGWVIDIKTQFDSTVRCSDDIWMRWYTLNRSVLAN